MLEPLFNPNTIAVIGASRTPGKIGHDVVVNAIQFGYKGTVYPVNPKAEEIAGLATVASVSDIQEQVDVAVIAVPAKFVPQVVEECGKEKIPFVVIISAGFKETGEQGARAEEQVKAIAQEYGIRIVGPNCLGFMNAHTRLNASFASGMPQKGSIALLSQSGAMGVALLDWAYEQRVGFSKMITVGNKSDIDEVSCLEYFASDPETKVIMMYLESIVDGKAFIEAASRIAQEKPIIVLKAGRSEEAKKAVSSHTGSLAGSEEAVNAAFKKAGIIRATTVEEFFDLGLAFSTQPEPAGNRVAIITNAGGPGIMAVDAVDTSAIELVHPSASLQKKLMSALPEAASPHNPIDILGDATHERYEHALTTVLQSKEIDAVVVILTPQVMTDEDEIARIVAELQQKYKKPVLTSFMGGADAHSAWLILDVRGIPNYTTPERAVKTIATMVQHAQRIVSPIHTAIPEKKIQQLSDVSHDIQIRTTEAEDILESYGVPVFKSQLLSSIEECDQLTDFPVVMKIASRDVVHKAATGAVEIGIESAEDAKVAWKRIEQSVKKVIGTDAEIEGMLIQPQLSFDNGATEVIIGMKRDASFGPLIVFGMGGSLVEVFKDVSFGIAPISLNEAKEMIAQIKAISLIQDCDINAIAKTIVALSQIALEYPEIAEIDINPLIAYTEKKGVIALDVRMMTK